MRTFISYVILIFLTLSSLTGSVALAHDITESNLVSTEHATPETPPCHGLTETVTVQDSTSHPDNCCMQDTLCDDNDCDKGCCAQHCVVTSALLNSALLNYIAGSMDSNNSLTTFATWLFYKDPPPPINA